MEKCSKCGTPLEQSQTFCGNCGYKTIREDLSKKDQLSNEIDNQNLESAIDDEKSSIYETPQSEFFNKNEFQYFKIGSLFFALSPIVTILVRMIIIDLDLITTISFIIDSIALLVFAFGLFSFSRIVSDNLTKDSRISAIFIGLYAVLYLLLNIYPLNLPTINIEEPTIQELQAFASAYIVPVTISFLITFLLLEGTISFNRMFKGLTSENNLPNTTQIKWFGITLTVANGLYFVGTLILFLSAENYLISFSLFSFSSLLLFAATILQFLAGYNVFKILKNLEFGRQRKDRYFYEDR